MLVKKRFAQIRLAEWMRLHRHSQTSAAAHYGVDQSTLCRWLNGEKIPAFPRMLVIQEKSGGFVQLHDWASPAPAQDVSETAEA